MKRHIFLVSFAFAALLAGCDQIQQQNSAEAERAALQAQYPATLWFFNENIGNKVLFATDKAILTDSARATLARQANWLIVNDGFIAQIQGNADVRGNRTHNLDLAARRSGAVRNYLISRGVQPERLKAATFGIDFPVADCSSAQCLEKNRNVFTVLMPI